jgi:hypothetical protein
LIFFGCRSIFEYNHFSLWAVYGLNILIIEICPLDNSSKDIIVASVLSDGWWWRKDTGHMVNPHAFSHWMPLPLSPKDSIRKKKE